MQETLQEIGKNILEYWFLIAMVATAGLMSIFRTAHSKGKVDWLESGMCALFAYGIWFALSWFNIPEGVGVLIGGFVGYKGTHVISKWVGDKIGMNSK